MHDLGEQHCARSDSATLLMVLENNTVRGN